MYSLIWYLARRAVVIQQPLHDIELFATVSAFDNSPTERFIEGSQRVTGVQIDSGVTELARIGFDGADECHTKSMASTPGFHE